MGVGVLPPSPKSIENEDRRALGVIIGEKKLGLGGGNEKLPRLFVRPVKNGNGEGDGDGEGQPIKLPPGDIGSPKNFGVNPLLIPGRTILKGDDGVGRVFVIGGNLNGEPCKSLPLLRTQGSARGNFDRQNILPAKFSVNSVRPICSTLTLMFLS